MFLSILLFLIFIGWFTWSLLGDRRERRQMQRRIAQKVALRRRLTEARPDSPAAYESLGDAFRESELPFEAITCYERARALEAERPVEIGSGGTGWIAGAGLETKLRLARLEAAAQATGTGALAHGQTMGTRQQICRRCGALCPAHDRQCENCGGALLVDTMADAWKENRIRRPILREAVNTFAMLFLMLLALSVASALPLDVKGALGISATIVLAWRFLRAVGGN